MSRVYLSGFGALGDANCDAGMPYDASGNPCPGGSGGGGALAICLDQSENTIACADPNCRYGDCGSTAPQQVGGALCLDQSENQIPCSNPSCRYGDCIQQGPKSPGPGITLAPAAGLNLPSRPSPVLNVPLSMSSIPLFLESSTLVTGVPNWELIVGVAVGAMLLSTAFSGGKRRRR